MNSTSERHLAELSPSQRQQLEKFLDEFERRWTPDHLIEAAADLVRQGEPVRSAALLEMGKIDMERQWKSGNRVVAEDYLDRLPDLAGLPFASLELVKAEIAARRRAGETVNQADYTERFPQIADSLRPLLARGAVRPAVGVARASPPPVPRRRPEARTLPREIGRYEIVKLLGQGGMGAVYLARDRELDRKVALKVPHRVEQSPELLERFTREARAAAALSHPNICKIYDVARMRLDNTPDAPEVPYLTMEFIEGSPLTATIAKWQGTMPPAKAAAIVGKLALALQAAHDSGVVHRDLKPANVLMRTDDQPIVMDFGLARRFDKEEVRLTHSGALVGTPTYMSPEQVSGAEVGPSSDIYTLGVIYYELLTGAVPFEADLPMAVLGQILTQAPVPPTMRRPDLDPTWEVICLKAMAKDPRERYPTMGDFAHALRDALKKPAKKRTTDVVPRLPSSPALPNPRATQKMPVPPPAGVRRKKLLVGAILGTLLLVALLAAQVVLSLRTPEGTLTVKVHDANLKVDVDGKTVKVDGSQQPMAQGDHTLKIRVGDALVNVGSTVKIDTVDKRLVVKVGDTTLTSNQFTVRKGDLLALEIKLEPVADAIPKAGGGEPVVDANPKGSGRDPIPDAIPKGDGREPVPDAIPKGVTDTKPVVPAKPVEVLRPDPPKPAPRWIDLDPSVATTWSWGKPLLGPGHRTHSDGQTTLDNGAVTFRQAEAKDSVLRAKVRFSRGQNAGLCHREQPRGGGCYYAYGYRENNGTGWFNLGVSEKGGAFRDLKTVQRKRFPTDFYEMEFSAIGDLFTVKVNGETLIEVRDGTHKEGTCGLNAFNARATFKDVAVKLLDP